MRDIVRFFTTLFIWGMVGGILIAAFVGDNSPVASSDVIPLTMFLSLAAAASTFAVWFSLRDSSDVNLARRGKNKRRYPRRVERLIEELDDDEIYDLEALLLDREQEVAARRQQM